MRFLKWAIAAAVIFVFAATPALADGPQPGTLPKSAYTGLHPGGAGRTGPAGKLGERATLNSQAPAGVNGPSAPNALIFYAWSNMMRFGSVGVNGSSWGCVNPNEVCSQTWSTTNQTIYFLQSGNYLCLNGSCTSWTWYGAYWWHWVWAGWRWSSTSWTWWKTVGSHYWNYGNGTYSTSSSLSEVF